MGNCFQQGRLSDAQIEKFQIGDLPLSKKEITLLYLVYESLKLRNKERHTIGFSAFAKFCPLQGYWRELIFDYVKSRASAEKHSGIDFAKFVRGAFALTKSTNDDLDREIFEIFDLQNERRITRDVMKIIIFNMPTIGFCTSNNFTEIDNKFRHLRK